MNRMRLLGIGICVVGFFLVYFGYQGATSDLSERILDGYVDTSKWYIFTGMGAVVAGSLVTLLWKQA